MQTKVLNSSIN